jgi:hypothetical protein
MDLGQGMGFYLFGIEDLLDTFELNERAAIGGHWGTSLSGWFEYMP